MQTIDRIVPLSLAKCFAVVYAVLAVLYMIAGAVASTLIVGNPFPGANMFAMPLSMMFGFPTIIATIIMLIVYVVFSFVTGGLLAATYNFAAKHLGGVQVQIGGQEVSTGQPESE